MLTNTIAGYLAAQIILLFDIKVTSGAVLMLQSYRTTVYGGMRPVCSMSAMASSDHQCTTCLQWQSLSWHHLATCLLTACNGITRAPVCCLHAVSSHGYQSATYMQWHHLATSALPACSGITRPLVGLLPAMAATCQVSLQ